MPRQHEAAIEPPGLLRAPLAALAGGSDHGDAVREVGHLALAEELRVDHVRLEHAPLRSLVVQHRVDQSLRLSRDPGAFVAAAEARHSVRGGEPTADEEQPLALYLLPLGQVVRDTRVRLPARSRQRRLILSPGAPLSSRGVGGWRVRTYRPVARTTRRARRPWRGVLEKWFL